MTPKTSVKKAVKPMTAAKKTSKEAGRHRAGPSHQAQIPDFYLTPQPLQEGRASIEIAQVGLEVSKGESKINAQMNVPVKHIGSFAGLTVGLAAASAPVLALGIACNASLPTSATVAVTAIAGAVSLVALLLLLYMNKHNST